MGVRQPFFAFALLVAVRAHDSMRAASAAGARKRSLGGVHDGAAALARRAALRAALAVAPAVHERCGAGGCNWTHSTAGYWEACGGAAGNVGSFSGLAPAAAEAACCANARCAGFSFECADASCATGGGFYKGNVDCGFVASAAQGWAQPSALPVLPRVTVSVAPAGELRDDATNVTVSFVFLTGAPNATTDWVGQVCAGVRLRRAERIIPRVVVILRLPPGPPVPDRGLPRVPPRGPLSGVGHGRCRSFLSRLSIALRL